VMASKPGLADELAAIAETSCATWGSSFIPSRGVEALRLGASIAGVPSTGGHVVGGAQQFDPGDRCRSAGTRVAGR
jgi:hypothetical protein